MLRDQPRIDGFVLAGGRSLRYGSNKALALYHGRPLLAHALRALRGLDIRPRIVAPDISAYVKFAADFITGERPGLGPVEGLRAALVSSFAPWSLVLSADMPGVTSAALRRLIGSIDRSFQVICFEDASSRRHPFPALYHHSLLHRIMRMADGGSMQRILGAARTRSVRQEEIGAVPLIDRILRNVNRPEDLARPDLAR